MKKYFFFITILFSVNFYVFSAVENISIADGLIFTPNTTINLEPLDEGLNLDDFLISESPSIKLERSDENRLSLGLMMNIKRKAYLGEESNFETLPIIEAKYDNFFIKPSTLDTISGYIGGYNFYSDRQFVLSGIVEYHLAEQDSKRLDSPYNQFIKSKDSEFYFGLSGKYIPEASPELSMGIDIGKNFLNSGALRIKAYGERYIPYTQDLYLITAFSYVFLDKDYCNYYYSVPRTKWTDSYEDFSGGKFGAHLDLVYSLGDNINFRSINSVEIFSNEISQSPIIANKINLNVGLGLMFTF